MPAVSLEQPNMQAFSRAFAGKIRELSVSQDTSEKREITPRDVYQPARPKNRAVFQEICKTLMLQDSRITGVENLAELAHRAGHELAAGDVHCIAVERVDLHRHHRNRLPRRVRQDEQQGIAAGVDMNGAAGSASGGQERTCGDSIT